MKRIGLIGGMSYESTQIYYRIINEEINRALKKSHSADLVMSSFDYQELKEYMEGHRWDLVEERLYEEGNHLKMIGAKGLVLCANTVHIVALQLEKRWDIPLIHIAKCVRDEVEQSDLKKVLLLGTQYTMQSDIYQTLFKEKGIEVITPSLKDQLYIHQCIYNELIVGDFRLESRHKIVEIIHKMSVQGVILGCTELPLLIKDEHLSIKRLDTLFIHAKAIAKWMLKE